MGLNSLIKKHKRIMFDTAPIIYFIEENKKTFEVVDAIFKVIRDNPKYYAFSSVVTVTEVLTQPLRLSNWELVKKYKNFLMNSQNFTIYSIDPIIAEKAAELRASYGIKTPDAIQMAVGIENNGTLFVTNDKNLQKVKEIETLFLNEYL